MKFKSMGILACSKLDKTDLVTAPAPLWLSIV